MKYTSISGTARSDFPTSPNGAQDGIAAISNHAGNALAIMPHPERSINPNRYPISIQAYAKQNGLTLTNFSKLFKAFLTPS